MLAGLSCIRKSNLDRVSVQMSKLPQFTMTEMFPQSTRCHTSYPGNVLASLNVC